MSCLKMDKSLLFLSSNYRTILTNLPVVSEGCSLSDLMTTESSMACILYRLTYVAPEYSLESHIFSSTLADVETPEVMERSLFSEFEKLPVLLQEP